MFVSYALRIPCHTSCPTCNLRAIETGIWVNIDVDRNRDNDNYALGFYKIHK